MIRRPVLAGVAAAAAALAALGIWQGWMPGSGLVRRTLPVPRNVLLITLDTLRADRLGCYGYTKGLTPNLDALARDGARFANTYTTVPLTTPSHSAILTGRYPLATGLRNNGSSTLPDEELLLSEILHQRGFRTGAIVSALVLAADYGLNQGFDLYYEEGIKATPSGSGLWFEQRPADQSVDRAITWLKANADRPFFLWLHLFDPHAPYEAPPPYREQYKDAPYNGEVAFTDAQVGRLLDEFKAMGLYDNSLIVALSDHGESLGEHGEPYHGNFLYQGTMHIPLLVRVPGGRRGVVVSDLTSSIDVAPTVLDALGIERPASIQGVSLLDAAARGGRVPARSVYLESIYPTATYGWATARAIVLLPWKLIDLPRPELYEATQDPAEKTNLYGERPAQVEDLRAEFQELVGGIEAGARAPEQVQLDDETLDRLQSLGYVGGQQSKASTTRGADPKDMAFMLTPMRIASDMLGRREFADAEEIFRKALEVDPDNRLVLLGIGRALIGQGKLDDAIPLYEHGVKVYPDVEEFYRAYGKALMSDLRLDAAEEVFQRALEHLPQSAQMHFQLGYTRFLAGRWSDAAEELDLAGRLGKKFGKPHYLLAICRLRTGDEAGALASLQEYLKRDPDVDSLFVDPYFYEFRRRPAFQELIKKHL